MRGKIILGQTEDASWDTKTIGLVLRSPPVLHFANEMNGNNIIICSYEINVLLGYLKGEEFSCY
jgi:hypothetical protein